MPDLTTVITVDVTGAGEVSDLAGELERADAAADKLKESLAGLGAGSLGSLGDLGFGAIGTQAEAAATKVGDSVRAIQDELKSLGDLGAGAFAGLDASASGVTGSLSEVGGELKSVADSAALADKGVASLGDTVKVTADANDALKTSAAGSAEGLKAQADAAGLARDATVGLGDASKTQAEAQAAMNKLVAEQTALFRENTAAMAEAAGVSADSRIASGNVAGIVAQSEATTALTANQVAAGAQARNLQKANEASAAAAAESGAKWHMAALGGAAALGYGAYLAAQLQTGTNRLYTSAGESLANLPTISQGILALSGQTDTSQASLMSGMYMAESAGFHGKNALAVERSAAEGAYAEGSDLGTTSNALTTVLDDYFGGAQKSPVAQQNQATSAMNAIMASVGAGKMTLQGISAALPTLLPTAQASGLKLQQVLGAMSTLTEEGTTPDEAAQELRGTIRAVQKPSGTQTAEMQMLGINPLQFESSLGKQGLTGTIQEADAAIKAHTKGNMVDLDVMNQSKLAMQSANAAVTELPKNLQSVAQGYLSGKTTEAQWYALTGTKSTLPETDVNLLKQFGSIANTALGFSSMIKSGQGDKQTQAAALNELFGGQSGQAVGVGLGGEHMKTFAGDVDTAGRSVNSTGRNIQGWNRDQESLNFKLGSFLENLKAVDTEAGQLALPALTRVAGVASGVLGAAVSHPAATKDVMEGAALLALPAVLSKVTSAGTTIAASAGKIGQALGIPGADKLAGIGQQGNPAAADAASGGRTRGGGAADAAAGALQGIVGASEKAVTGETAAGAAGEKEAIGETAAGGAGGKEAIGETAGGAGGAGGGSVLSKVAITAFAALMLEQFLRSQKNSQGNWWDNGLGTPSSSAWNSTGTLGKDIGSGWGLLDSLQHNDSRKDTGDRITAAPATGSTRWGYTIAGPAPAPPLSAAQLNASAHDLFPQSSALLTPAQALQGNADMIAQRSPGLPAPPPVKATAWPAAKAPAAEKIPAPDTSALDSAKAKIDADYAGIAAAAGRKISPLVIPAPDMAALDTAKTKVSSDMTGISAAMKSEAGPAGAAGGAVAAGFASGIGSGSGAVAAAASMLGETAIAALRASIKSSSPSRLSMVEGENYADGFILGIDGKLSAVTAEAEKMARALDEPVKSAAKIGSDTAGTLTANLQGGQSAITAAQDLAAGITAPFKDSTIASTLTTMDNDVAAALKKHTINASEASGIDAWLSADNARLQKLASQRSQLETQIQQAQAYGQNITASANQGANIVGIAQNAQAADQSTSAPPPAEPVQASDLIAGMQAQVQQTKQFGADLAKLKKEGLNKAELDQIAQAGAAAGDPVAQGIIAGGPAAVKELNKLAAEMNAAAKQLGQTAESTQYDPAKDKSQLKAVDAQMASIAKTEVDALKAALSGGAAAAAFDDVGSKIASEIAAGVSGSASAVVSALVSAIEAAEEVVAGGGKSGKGGKGGSGGKSASSSAHAHSGAVSHPAAAAGGGAGPDKAIVPRGSDPGSGFGVGPGSFGVPGPGSLGVRNAPHPATAAGGGSTAAGYWTGSGGGSSGGGGDTHIHMHVAGSVVTENQIARNARTWNMNNASNNWRGGNQFPGRGI
jgi:hypothetical protein